MPAEAAGGGVICYVTSKHLRNECNKISVIKQRASMVHELICGYNELYAKLTIVEPSLATEEELQLFHSKFYVDYLKQHMHKSTVQKSPKQNLSQFNDEESSSADDSSSSNSDVDEEMLEYGLGYDCPKLKNLWEFVTTIAGGTLTAVNALLNGSTRIAINWCGGWHHAQRDEAEGFCYVNDIGIGIQKLRENFQRVLYVDLDVHHGNGVENGFSYTKNVLTLSFHQYEPGFFPGSGKIDDCGMGTGKGYAINFPYLYNVKGQLFVKYFLKVSELANNLYQPDVCVVQCGGDVIVGDALGGTNLLPQDLGLCIEKILKWNLPTIFLGGGGYNLTNTSRYWTYLTSIICQTPLSDNIPDNKFFLKYGPGYELSLQANKSSDLNTEADFERNYCTILEKLMKYLPTKS